MMRLHHTRMRFSFMLMIVLLFLTNITLQLTSCPIGYHLSCSGDIGVESEKCCTCQPIPGTCPGGYTSGLSSCAKGFRKKCIDVVGKECCACFPVDDPYLSDDGKSHGCEVGFASGTTKDDCPVFDSYNVILDCKGMSDLNEACCRCKLVPVGDKDKKKKKKGSGEIFQDSLLKVVMDDCPDSYSRKIGTCPSVFGIQSKLECVNEVCCRCEFPEGLCPKGLTEEDKFDPYSCQNGRISCQSNVAGTGKCCQCIVDVYTKSATSNKKKSSGKVHQTESKKQHCSEGFYAMEIDEKCSFGESKICAENGVCCTCMSWSNVMKGMSLQQGARDAKKIVEEQVEEQVEEEEKAKDGDLLDLESVRRSILNDLRSDIFRRSSNTEEDDSPSTPSTYDDDDYDDDLDDDEEDDDEEYRRRKNTRLYQEYGRFGKRKQVAVKKKRKMDPNIKRQTDRTPPTPPLRRKKRTSSNQVKKKRSRNKKRRKKRKKKKRSQRDDDVSPTFDRRKKRRNVQKKRVRKEKPKPQRRSANIERKRKRRRRRRRHRGY